MAQIVVPYLAGALDNLIEPASYLIELCGKSEAALHIEKLCLRALYGVTHSLTGYPLVLCDFGKREIIVVIISEKVALLFSQHITVKVKQNRYFKIFCHCAHAPFSAE